jgi:hypothetical protein
MAESFCPRLSEATILLPLLRAHLVAAASGRSLPRGRSLDLLPIVEEGLFGYEIVPHPEIRICLAIGSNETGVPVVRTTSYGTDASNALQLVSVNGRSVTRRAAGMRLTQRRESRFPDWHSAVASAWSQLAALLPDRPRQPVELNETSHRLLDEALSVAHSHLAAWDPFIRFDGLPNEAQLGYRLHGAAGSHGELVSQWPHSWILRWKSPPHAIYEEWSVGPPDREAAAELTRA